MPAIPEDLVQQVVEDVSKRMNDPNFAQVAIGNFAQSHPDVGRYITAHLTELGGGEGVMHAVFHAEVLNMCFQRHLGRSMSPIRFDDLNDTAERAKTKTDDEQKQLRKRHPALADYLDSNVEEPPMRQLLALVGLAMADAAL